MTMFKLSENINTKKMFLVNRSEIDGRLDPVMVLFQKENTNFKYPAFQIKNLLKTTPQYGANEAGISRFTLTEPRYIRITDIDEFGNLSSELGKTAEKIEEKYYLENNDIIIARSGNTVGKSYIHKSSKVNYDCFFAGYMIRFKFNEETIKPDFVFVVTQLPFYKKWTNAVQRLAGQPNINAEEYKSLKIPVPSLTQQQKIIDVYNKALEQKQQKEAQAKKLLAGIDEYLLGELGVSLPQKDNSLENRIFKTSFQKVTGNRFDPKLYDTHSQRLFQAIEDAKYPKVPLKHLIIQSFAGDWGLDENADLSEQDYRLCMVIRATEFDNDFNLNIENSRAKYRKIKTEKLTKLDIQPNDLLIEKSGGSPDQPVGRISILTKELVNNNNLCYSNFIHKIRVDTSKIYPEYLFCFLKTIHNIKVTEIMQSQTNGIRNLIMREYFNQSIVLPEVTEKQKEIAQQANKMRYEAQRLQQEAKQELENARNEVEQMILNEK